MNALALIQQKLQTQAKVETYNKSISYRGVSYTPGSGDAAESHGVFVYRGRSYTK